MKVDRAKCMYCGGCVGVCPTNSLELMETALTVNEDTCTKCLICVRFCPVGAIEEDKK